MAVCGFGVRGGGGAGIRLARAPLIRLRHLLPIALPIAMRPRRGEGYPSVFLASVELRLSRGVLTFVHGRVGRGRQSHLIVTVASAVLFRSRLNASPTRATTFLSRTRLQRPRHASNSRLCAVAGGGVRYDRDVPLPLFVLSGIGGDERLFDRQRAVRDIRPIRWIPPSDAREPLTHYAARLAREIRITEPFDLGGSSFGGMIALELARHLSPRRVFLFGSCRSPNAVAPSLRALRSLTAMLPDRLLQPPRILQPLIARWFGATSQAQADLFAQMFVATPTAFVRWASRALLSWPGVAELPMPIHHVHGDRDRLIPLRRVEPDCVIPRAGHLLTNYSRRCRE